MKCPHCGGEINPAALIGSIKSAAKAKASRANAKLGGWPKGKKRGKRKTLRQPNNAEQTALPSFPRSSCQRAERWQLRA